MSIQLCNLPDVEKYFFSELAYLNPPGELRFAVTQQTPMPLADFFEHMGSAAASGQYPPLQTEAFHKRFGRLQTVLARSKNLRDVMICGYINDNHGEYGNTQNRWKSSLGAMAFRDSEGNGIVAVRGCEMGTLSSAVIDWGGCGLAFAGITTSQHRRALRFFDEQMRSLPGQRGLVGHSKGGNVVTYLFIKRLDQDVHAYCINAQPYCWPAMSHEQKAALKSERYEYIVHVKDFAKKFGYVSYVSRTVPLNRYVEEGGLTSHEFSEIRFDELGNLEGEKVLRETGNSLASIVLRDDIAEKRHSYEESLAVFREQMGAITHTPRLLSVGLEEIMLTMRAQAATLWLCDEDDEGAYIYPYIVKGPASEALYRLKLRPGSGIAARSAFCGEALLAEEAAASPHFMPGVDRSTGFETKAMITVPLQAENATPGAPLGALQILNKADGTFDDRDLHLAAAMAACMSEVFVSRGGSAEGVREFRLLRIYTGDGQELFAIEQNEFRQLEAATPEEARRQMELLQGKTLAPGDWLVFNRKVFDASMAEQLARMRERDISTIELPGRTGLSPAEAQAALDAAMEKRPMLVIADLSGGCAQCEGGQSLAQALNRLCQERTTTAVVLQ